MAATLLKDAAIFFFEIGILKYHGVKSIFATKSLSLLNDCCLVYHSNMMELLKSLGFSSNCYLCGCATNTLENIKCPVGANSAINSPLLCHYCHQRLPISRHCCFSCGLPMMSMSGENLVASPVNSATTCGECLKNSPPYDRVISAFHYEPPVSDFITQLKYSAQFPLLPILSEYLIQKIQSSYDTSTLPRLIVATPLHPKKLVSRGFNQSRLIANKVGKVLNIKVLDKGVERIKQTEAQSGLDSVERKKNMQNAFLVQAGLPEHVAVIDDVVTTGMTATELSKQLLKHGAKRVDIWCLARAYDL